MPLIPAVGKQRQEDRWEIQANMVNIEFQGQLGLHGDIVSKYKQGKINSVKEPEPWRWRAQWLPIRRSLGNNYLQTISKADPSTADIGQLKGPILHNNIWPHIHNQYLKHWADCFNTMLTCPFSNWLAFLQVSWQLLVENSSTTSRMQKMLSKSLSNPQGWNFTLQEEVNLFLHGKDVGWNSSYFD